MSFLKSREDKIIEVTGLRIFIVDSENSKDKLQIFSHYTTKLEI